MVDPQKHRVGPGRDRLAIGSRSDPQVEQSPDLLEGKAEFLGMPDEPDALEVGVGVLATACWGSGWIRQESLSFIEPDGLQSDPGCPSQCSRCHGAPPDHDTTGTMVPVQGGGLIIRPSA